MSEPDDFGATPWWEFDPEERPVPLGGVQWEAADDAELIVNAEREAIIREDTEPTIMAIPHAREPHQLSPRGISSRSGPATVAAAVLLAAACGAMFSLGWNQGATAAASSPPPDLVRPEVDRKADVTQDTPGRRGRPSLRDSSSGEKTSEEGDGR